MTTLVKKVATGALAALTLGGATLATASPAAAQHWRGGYGGYHGGYGGYHRGYGGAGLAVAGLAGLAIGASLAERPYYGGGYGYYGRPYYGGYYAPSYYAPGYYYGPRYGYRHDWCYYHPYRC